MENTVPTAWVEAAARAADETFKAIGEMASLDALDLGVGVIGAEEAIGTNSCDSDFIAHLERGGHLNANFLANATR